MDEEGEDATMPESSEPSLEEMLVEIEDEDEDDEDDEAEERGLERVGWDEAGRGGME